MSNLGVVFIVVFGYVAAVFTWDKLHKWFIGAEEYALSLRDKAKVIEDDLRKKAGG
jgi:hypothetical protein